MRVLCLILLAATVRAAPQPSPEDVSSPSVPPSPPAAGDVSVAVPSGSDVAQLMSDDVAALAVVDVGNVKVIGVLDEEIKEEVDNIEQGYNRLRNLGVMDLEDEIFDEEGIGAEQATFKLKKILKLAKIALIVMGVTQSNTTESMAAQVQQLMELLNVRDSNIASNAVQIVSAAQQEQHNAFEKLDEADVTKRVAALLAQVPDTAVASLEGPATGQILFAQNAGTTVMMGTIVGLSPGEHHVAIYQSGNCRGPGDLFDYSGAGQTSLGRVMVDDAGRATIMLRSESIGLTGPRSVLGRTVVVAPVEEGSYRPPLAITYAAAAPQFVPSVGALIAAEEEWASEQNFGDFSCGVIVRE